MQNRKSTRSVAVANVILKIIIIIDMKAIVCMGDFLDIYNNAVLRPRTTLSFFYRLKTAEYSRHQKTVTLP